MKKTIKVLLAILLVIMMVAMASNVFAASTVIDQLANDSNVDVDTGAISTTVGRIIAMIRNISIIAGVLIIVILGFKYMMGSLQEKADYKKSFVPLIVGIVIIMGATSIASFLFNLF